MFEIDSIGATPDHRFTEGDPNIPVLATEVSADWLNMVQDELKGVVIAGDLAPTKGNNAQVVEAIKKMIVAGRQSIEAVGPISVTINEAGKLVVALAPGKEGEVLKTVNNVPTWVADSSSYFLSEFYFFRHPTLRPGFQPAQGGLIENAATLYPEAWAYFQTAEGQLLCKTETEWQAMTQAVWHTLADGTQVGWNGIGGAPFYAPNLATGALRLPDIRGMYMEAAGFDGLGVGMVHGDAMRSIRGEYVGRLGIYPTQSGPFVADQVGEDNQASGTGKCGHLLFDSSRVVPIANKFQPRAFGVLPCVYLGTPK